jgi:PilZ domain-containing protein
VADIRTSRRFPVHLPLKVLGEQGTPVGLTENISAAGVYLWVDGGLEVGSSAEFEITIPGETVGADSDVRLHCQGRVIRCDHDQQQGRSGVACVIERYEILRGDQAAGAGDK